MWIDDHIENEEQVWSTFDLGLLINKIYLIKPNQAAFTFQTMGTFSCIFNTVL